MPGTRALAPSPGEVTHLIQAWRSGDEAARDRLIPVVYAELRRRAAGHLRRERQGHTLRPTDLVHETYLRLAAQNPAWQNREQLFAVASRLMRRLLVDHARRRAAAKRGGLRVTLVEGMVGTAPGEPDLLDLEAALDELAALDERQVQLVELRFFGGLGIEEAARCLGVSVATANRDWAMAKSWLYRRLQQGR
ncbi:MAG TPA: ECF-type sigma factor [Vicinamibacteria bacterium]|nr:ECF-type sigma factor [Vicinamibacteria bacterium]